MLFKGVAMAYRQVELPCPQVHENKKWACVDLSENIVAVILSPITKCLLRVLIC